MSIKLKLEGFEELLREIEKAGGSITYSTKKCVEKSAEIMQEELKSQMARLNVDNDLIARMPPPEFETTANRITARVGYKKGVYDPKNPSDGYLVAFINYGTPNRTEHGKIRARGFIKAAKRKAKKQIKAEQEKTLKEILKGLQQ